MFFEWRHSPIFSIFSGLRPFQCQLCKRGYTNKVQLLAHLRKIHAVECEAVDNSFAKTEAIIDGLWYYYITSHKYDKKLTNKRQLFFSWLHRIAEKRIMPQKKFWKLALNCPEQPRNLIYLKNDHRAAHHDPHLNICNIFRTKLWWYNSRIQITGY